MGISLPVETDSKIVEAVYVQHNERRCQVQIAVAANLYLVRFEESTVCRAHARSGDLQLLLHMLHSWLNQNIAPKDLAGQYDVVVNGEDDPAFETVTSCWDSLLLNELNLGLTSIILLAGQDAVLSRLFPYTSLYTLRFSRCTGYPFDTDDMPMVTPIQFEHFAQPHDGKIRPTPDTTAPWFVVTRVGGKYLGEGDAATTLHCIKAHLPQDIGPARPGSADQPG